MAKEFKMMTKEIKEEWKGWTETTGGLVELVNKSDPVADGDLRVEVDSEYDFLVFSKMIDNQLKWASTGRTREDWIANGHGEYTTLANELDFLDVPLTSRNIVLHFCDTSNMRCSIMDKHLALLAKKHIETKFCKLNIENASFLCKYFGLTEFPTLMLCNGSIRVDFVRGFDDFAGGFDDAPTEALEKRLAELPCISYDRSSDGESDGYDDSDGDD